MFDCICVYLREVVGVDQGTIKRLVVFCEKHGTVDSWTFHVICRNIIVVFDYYNVYTK